MKSAVCHGSICEGPLSRGGERETETMPEREVSRVHITKDLVDEARTVRLHPKS